jgi:hypothetical protein
LKGGEILMSRPRELSLEEKCLVYLERQKLDLQIEEAYLLRRLTEVRSELEKTNVALAAAKKYYTKQEAAI